MTTSSRPKGALAQALYCKLNHDMQMEANFDYQSWYRLGKCRRPPLNFYKFFTFFLHF